MAAGFSRLMTAAVLTAGIALVPAAQARSWHGHYYHRGYGRGGGAAAAAVVGGLVGLGVGAAIASQGYAPPPVYYGPPPAYYAPPPAVYYGY
jgi:hypothetical protein